MQPRPAPPVLRSPRSWQKSKADSISVAVQTFGGRQELYDAIQRNLRANQSSVYPRPTMDQSSKPTFNFVNLKHPDDLKDEETQLRIRRLAMTEVGKARRKPKNKRGRSEIVLELRNTTRREPGIDRLGSDRIDPFGRYPIELDNEARALVANSKFTGRTDRADC
jgi:hypothetical protein